MFAQRITAVKAFFQEHHHLPRRRSEDRHEQTLANWLDKAKQRKGRALSSKPCKRQLTPTEAAQLDELLDVEILAPDASTEAMQEREAELCARCRMPYYENANFCAGCGYKRFGTAPSQASTSDAAPKDGMHVVENDEQDAGVESDHENENAMVHHSARSNPQPKAKRKQMEDDSTESSQKAHRKAEEDEDETCTHTHTQTCTHRHAHTHAHTCTHTHTLSLIHI